MNSFGFYKIAAVSPAVKVGNPLKNAEKIIEAYNEACKKGASVIVTPELSLTAYTCGDLLFTASLKKATLSALKKLIDATNNRKNILVVGAPVENGGLLFDCAVAIADGKIIGVVPKTFLSNSGDAYEKRWFSSSLDTQLDKVLICGNEAPFGSILFSLSDELTMGIEIGSELFAPVSPSSMHAVNGANLIVNLCADGEISGKKEYREEIIKAQSSKLICAYALASAGIGESTTDGVFAGASMIAQTNSIISCTEGFSPADETVITYGDIDAQKINFLRTNSSAYRDSAKMFSKQYQTVHCDVFQYDANKLDVHIDDMPFVPYDEKERAAHCTEIFEIQATALARRMQHTGMKKCVVGISGGLDSTLAILVCAKALDKLSIARENIIAVTMPGFGTTDRTYTNALELMRSLGATIMEISIKDACIQHMKDIGHDKDIHDVTYENMQARERTQILMDIANKHNALHVGTGDLSEMALGWCTYNGDHMSMYGVNADVPKTLVRSLVENAAEASDEKTAAVLRDIVDTPVSPELLPPDAQGKIAQKTEDKIGPYELHDFFLYHFIKYGADKEKIIFLAQHAFGDRYETSVIEKWASTFMRRFFVSQFKRSCVPDGPKVGTIALSPRGDWKMPSDADMSIWL